MNGRPQKRMFAHGSPERCHGCSGTTVRAALRAERLWLDSLIFLSYINKCYCCFREALGKLFDTMLDILIVLLLAHLANTFPLLLDKPSLLNVSAFSLFNPPSRNSSAVLEDQRTHCLEPQIGRLKPDSRDCDVAISLMNKDFTHETMRFSRKPNADFKLPKSYRSGSCVFYLDMVHGADEDTVSTTQLMTDALTLNRNCVRDPDPWKHQLGGVMSVWPRDLLYVVLFGGDPRAVS